MAHFAELNESNEVIQVVVVANEDIADGRFASGESEEKGISFLQDLLGADTKWVQTSYNSNFRGRYANPGFIYYPGDDVFAPSPQFPSWVLDVATGTWSAPVPVPDDAKTGPDDDEGKIYYWDEPSLSWVETDEELSNVPPELLLN